MKNFSILEEGASPNSLISIISNFSLAYSYDLKAIYYPIIEESRKYVFNSK